MLPRLKARKDDLKSRFDNLDWQELSEKLDPGRITNDPKFKRFMERLNLPDYVKGPDDETEFLPAALEIVETPPAPAARIVGCRAPAWQGASMWRAMAGRRVREESVNQSANRSNCECLTMTR
jgi:hypothetical protein